MICIQLTIKRIISNVLKSLYQSFFFAVIVSVLVLFFVLYCERYTNYNIIGKIKCAFIDLKNRFVNSKRIRRMSYLIFFISMIMFKTLLLREMWTNPISDVLGVWGFHRTNGEFTTEIVENVVLFIPLIFFLFFFLETTSKKTSKFFAVMWRAIVISFLSSLAIEMLQLFLRLGTWQLSDLCFNTLGGVIGGLIYWVSAKIRGK